MMCNAGGTVRGGSWSDNRQLFVDIIYVDIIKFQVQLLYISEGLSEPVPVSILKSPYSGEISKQGMCKFYECRF